MPSILLVEDDEKIQKMYSMALTMEGFEVNTATSAGEAMVRVEEAHYDIILLDMLLSGMSGLDFLRSYNVPEKSPGTKVIGLSNLDNPTIAEKARELGALEFLNKSAYEPPELAAHLKQLLAQP